MSSTTRTAFDVVVPLDHLFTDSHTVIVNKISVDQTTKIDINLSDVHFKNLFKVQSQGSSGIVNDTNLLISNFKSFFNIKSNVRMFADELYTILSAKYPNLLYINIRKLRNLCKSEGNIWNELFLSKTIFKDVNNIERQTEVYEEIAIDFQNMIEQDEDNDNDIEYFWNNLVPGDNVTLRFSLNMSNFSSSESTINIFVKFNVLNGSDSYNFNLN